MSDIAPAESLPTHLPDGGVVLIDWGCGFCQKTRRWIERHAPEDHFLFLALGSKEGDAWLVQCGRSPDDEESVVHVTAGPNGDLRCSDRSTAVLRILRRMDRPYRFLYAGVVVPRPLRDLGYHLVSKHRHRLA